MYIITIHPIIICLMYACFHWLPCVDDHYAYHSRSERDCWWVGVGWRSENGEAGQWGEQCSSRTFSSTSPPPPPCTVFFERIWYHGVTIARLLHLGVGVIPAFHFPNIYFPVKYLSCVYYHCLQHLSHVYNSYVFTIPIFIFLFNIFPTIIFMIFIPTATYII